MTKIIHVHHAMNNSPARLKEQILQKHQPERMKMERLKMTTTEVVKKLPSP